MKRRHWVVLISVVAVLGVAALSAQKKSGLLVLEWAGKAKAETPPVAILVEMGLKDDNPMSWSGRATVTGARVVHREGYRFRKGDKLIEPDGWEATSHRGLRLPLGQPALKGLEPNASIGLVLHLSDVKPDATLTLEPKDKAGKTIVEVKDLLAGQTKLLWDKTAAVRRISTTVPLVTAKTEDDFPAAAFGPDGTLWVAYVSYTVRDDDRRIEQSNYKEQPKDFKSLYTPEFADQLFVKYQRDGKWSEPIAVTGPKEDLIRCAVAVDGDGVAWVAYGAHREGRHRIYARPISSKYAKAGGAGGAPQPGPERNLTPETGRYLAPMMCTHQDGRVRVAFQASTDANDGNFSTRVITLLADDKTEQIAENFSNQGHQWTHSLAAGPNGELAVAQDAFFGDYDVQLEILGPGALKGTVAGTSKFEARPSLAYDPKGRLWIAYEEGPMRWGRDYGALVPNKGSPLYNERSVRVVCVQGGKLFRPAAVLPTSEFKPPTLPFEAAVGNKYERATRYAYPQIGIDGKGRVWLTYRQKFGTRYTCHPGSYWLTFARRLDGDKWSEPIELHHSDGLLDDRPALLPHPSGGLIVVHNTDGRYTTPETIDNQIYLSHVDLPGEPVEPKLVPHDGGKKDPAMTKYADDDREAAQRIRAYHLEVGDKKYQLLRGEFHRHTEISWDGGPDGSLEDMFRYGMDVAAFDWIGNADHDNGAGREYTWWLTQKFTDAYLIPQRFTPMFTYERSVIYPHGHRNCIFTQRGVRTLPRLDAGESKPVGGVHADDTKMLYRYLHEFNGICASHTSATSMGTDWRDNDPKVEPMVEVYQGDRMSYEQEGAPRAGYDPQTNKFPGNVAGWYPAGFINNAFNKGYRFAFESSSDHWSTHISYCIVLAEKNDRASIHAAMQKRHCYAATDNIIVDVRSGTSIMGDELKTNAPPALQIKVIGTKPLAQVDVLKDSEVAESFKAANREFTMNWTDPKPTPGVHYYYIRVRQNDDELAWGSPLWIDYVK